MQRELWGMTSTGSMEIGIYISSKSMKFKNFKMTAGGRDRAARILAEFGLDDRFLSISCRVLFCGGPYPQSQNDPLKLTP